MFKKFFIAFVLVFAVALALPALAVEETNTTVAVDNSATTEATETAVADPAIPQEISATDLDVAEPSVLPGSFWYPFKKFSEKVQEILTIKPESKAKLEMRLANKRLVEARVLAKQGKTDELDKTIEEYKSRAEAATKKLGEIDTSQMTDEQKEKIANLKDKITENSLKQIQVLEKVRDQVPEQARESIEKNIEKAKERLQERLDKLSAEDAGKIQERLDSIMSKLPGNEATKADFVRTIKEIKEVTKDAQLKEKLQIIEQKQAERVGKLITDGKLTPEKGQELLERMKEKTEDIKEKAEKAKEATQKLKEKVEEDAQKVKEKAQEVKETAQERLKKLKETTTEK